MNPKFRKFLKRIKNHFPSKLPTGGTEFVNFVDDILDTYDLPKLPNYKRTIATMILQNQDPTCSRKPKAFFAKCIKQAMSKQIAFEMMKAINEDEDAQKKKQVNAPDETI